MAVIALLLLGISFVPTFFLEHGNRVALQLSNCSWICASLLIAIIGVLSTIHYSKGRHIFLKIIGWLVCGALVYVCLISLYFALIKHDKKIWSSKDYVVYSEYRGFFEANKFVLYKRDGLIDRRMFFLGDNGFGEVKGADYSMYNDFDLVKEDVDVTEFDSDSVFHCTTFYRLSDGYQYSKEKNDSLLNVIKY